MSTITDLLNLDSINDFVNGTLQNLCQQLVHGIPEPKCMVIIPQSDEEYASMYLESDNRYSAQDVQDLMLDSMRLNHAHLVRCGVSNTVAKNVSIYRALCIVRKLYPYKASQVAPCKYEIKFTDDYQEGDQISEGTLHYNNLSFYTRDLMFMIFLANRSRAMNVHLYQASQDTMINKLKLTLQKMSTDAQEIKFTGEEMRLTLHCMGFEYLRQVAGQTANSLPKPLKIRSLPIYNGTALIPTSCVILQMILGSQVTGARFSALLPCQTLLLDASGVIKEHGFRFCSQYTLYGYQLYSMPQVTQLCKLLAPLLQAYLDVFLSESDLSKQKVVDREAQLNIGQLVMAKSIFTQLKNEAANMDVTTLLDAIIPQVANYTANISSAFIRDQQDVQVVRSEIEVRGLDLRIQGAGYVTAQEEEDNQDQNPNVDPNVAQQNVGEQAENQQNLQQQDVQSSEN